MKKTGRKVYPPRICFIDSRSCYLFSVDLSAGTSAAGNSSMNIAKSGFMPELFPAVMKKQPPPLESLSTGGMVTPGVPGSVMMPSTMLS